MARRHSNLILDLQRGGAPMAQLDDACGAQAVEGRAGERRDCLARLQEVVVEKLLGIDLAVILAKARTGRAFPGRYLGSQLVLNWTPNVADLVASLYLTDAKAAVVDEGLAELDHVRRALAGIAGQEIGAPDHAGEVRLGRGALLECPGLVAALAWIGGDALGNRVRRLQMGMSAFHPKAAATLADRCVCFGPNADIAARTLASWAHHPFGRN